MLEVDRSEAVDPMFGADRPERRLDVFVRCCLGEVDVREASAWPAFLVGLLLGDKLSGSAIRTAGRNQYVLSVGSGNNSHFEVIGVAGVNGCCSGLPSSEGMLASFYARVYILHV